MTYNFDPEAWYDNELAFLQAQRAAGKLSEESFQEQLAKLDLRYEQMVERLDGTYQIPRGKDRSRG